jgi:uncharacterized protein HemX
MFGFSIYKILGIVIAVGLLVGYYKYTQDRMDALNQEIATKAFALQAAQATIEQQQKDMQHQQEVMKKTNDDFQAARAKVGELENKFSQIDLDLRAREDAVKLEEKVNGATKRVFRCVEDVINKGSKNAAGC